MTINAPVRAPRHRRAWRGPALSLLLLVLAIGGMLYFVHLNTLAKLVANANPWWLVAALLCKLLGPFATALVYDRTLRLLGYRLKLLPFWLVAQVATWVNGALPAGPLAMSALLLRIFRLRGIPEAATTVAVALDTFTYQVAFFSVFASAIAYLLVQGAPFGRALDLVAPLALGLGVVAAYLWLRRYERAQITQHLVRVQQWLARRLHRPWQPASVERFVGELARSVDLARARPLALGSVLLFQLVVIGLDILILLCLFHALGQAPPVFNIVLSTTLAAFLTTLVPLPGGGGTFEATLVLSSVQAGVPREVALGATVIYRVLTFWLPLLLTAATYRRLLGAPAQDSPPLSAPEQTD